MTGLLKRQWRDQTARRRLVMLVSGALLLLGLGADAFVATTGLREPLLATAALVAGADIARRAFDGLRRRQFTIDLLVTIAAVGALAIGEAWEAAAVTFLFVFGAWLEARTLGRTRQALSNLLELAPVTALVMRGGEPVEVDPTDVRLGETVMVRPGARIPVDGIVREGRAAVDESAITGESMPAEKGSGDAVYAGTVSRDGMLMLEATGVGADTTLARIVHRVEEAQDARAPVQRTIERFAGWYTPSIIVLAVLAGLLTGKVELALTLLVIGCPGAMVIATPVAIVAGIGRAASRGILVKGGEYLETIGRVGTVAFDKTGTLTRGKPVLTDVVALQSLVVVAADSGAVVASPGADEDAVLRWAAIAENGSAHPLAPPIVEAARAVLDEPIPLPEHGEAVPGKGIRARWQGHAIDVGTPALLDDLGIALDAEARAQLARLQDAGKTAMLVALDGEAIGLLGVTDVPRANAAEVAAELRRIGVRRLAMLSGDNPRTAAKVAQSVGIDEVHAGILPEGKLEWIRARQAEGEVVAMVGDGINDAPALAAADVGIAMGAAGSDIALETADVALMADQLERIPEALRISRATVRVIRQNLVIALLTVAALLGGVLAGHVDMAGGMLVHQGSVLVVILNAMRLMRA
ncbi:MAG: cation-translocating P-type ATPase [Burkholderiaceae bacterium]|nr:cation-translocating P-type ATPase [Burkholderiaceae bacterium]MEB2351054.1 cation-translocating P-type ATPase [Burkholderiaceae bacterium]